MALPKHKKIAILQSNYIPWKGYFDLISFVDEFVIYDSVQFTKNDWRNRNLIKTPTGEQWLTIPVGKQIHRNINEVEINSDMWQRKHWNSIKANYGRASYFMAIKELLEELYLGKSYAYLTEVNSVFIQKISRYLRIDSKISSSSDFRLEGDATQRLVSLCEQLGADEYVSGPNAQTYLREEDFNSKQIKITWFDYDDYPEYPQLWSGFTHKVSILDLLLNCGPDSTQYMKYVE